MKTTLFASAILLLAIASCNQTQQKTNPEEYPVNDPLLGNITTDTVNSVLTENEKCFTAALKNDSAFLKLKNVDGKVEGKLWNKFAEKDNSKGTLSGTMVGDTINLNYTFNAEGSTSERPIKMLIKDGK